MPVAGSFIEEIKKYFVNTTPKIILDVGSRDLEESIQISHAFPDARIIAFEPNPIQFKICQKNAKLYPNIEVYEYACSDDEAIVDFFIVEGNIGASSILEPMRMPGGWDNGYQERPWHKISGITTKRLDDILTELGITQVDVIWIDVQGNELRALKGMGKLINNVKMIHAEAALRPYYKGHQLKEELEQWLNEEGFDTEFLDLRAQAEHPYGESDLLCIRKNIHNM